jgi:peptidoglycan hydrolase-like protein with peptidoglycan-binding domain
MIRALLQGYRELRKRTTRICPVKQVRMVQEALQEEGYAPGRSDGAMDNDTRAAIREFQSDNNITVTGTVDSRTAQLLGIRYDRSSG